MGLALVAAALVCVVAVALYFGRLLETALERGGRYALGVETRVGFAALDPFAGAFRVRGLRIANPPGFVSDHFLQLASLSLDVDLATLRAPTVVIPHIGLTGADLVLERNADGSNVQAILDHLKRFEKGDARAPSPDEEAGRRVVVDELVITDLTARVQATPTLALLLGSDQGLVPLEIPEIRLVDLGKGRPISMAELNGIIVKALLTAVARRGAGVLPALVVRDLGSRLRALGVVEGVDAGAKRAREALGGLLRGKREDD
ncbi:MAG: hypothetical protein QNK03_11050 [Myxococcota bacterium]|nr:hypothetical protein [Myxococcota bacterium]